MKLRRLAELSALVALFRSHIIEADGDGADRALTPYLHHARQRAVHWRIRLQRLSHGGSELSSQPEPLPAADALTPFVAELFVSELLTRVWTAVLVARDRHRGLRHAGPIARHVLVGVLEARSRLLQHLLIAVSPLGTLLQADRLRRKCERWTDLLISELGGGDDELEFAVDPVRAAEYRLQRRSRDRGAQPATWTLLTAGIQQAVPDLTLNGVDAVPHRGVVEAIRSALPEDLSFPSSDLGPNGSAATATMTPGVVRAEPPPMASNSAGRRSSIAFHELLRRIALERQAPRPEN